MGGTPIPTSAIAVPHGAFAQMVITRDGVSPWTPSVVLKEFVRSGGDLDSFVDMTFDNWAAIVWYVA